MHSIETAVIPVGGLGTRFFPLSKTFPKYMLPIGNRPVLDYMIDNCLEAGISRIIFTVAEGDEKLDHYTSEDESLRERLGDLGKTDLYKEIVEPLHSRAEIIVAEQTWDGRYGTATGLLPARPHLTDGKPFLYTMGDNFLWRADGGSDIADMIASFEKRDVAAATLVQHVRSFEALSKCAAALIATQGPDNLNLLDHLVEKPTIDYRPRFASIGRHILRPEVFDIIEGQKPNPVTEEFYITDTINILAEDSDVLVHVMKGKMLDCGTPDNLFETTRFLLRHSAVK